jgi:hypothetical protein
VPTGVHDSPQNALGVNNEEATQGDAVFLEEDTVIPRNLHCLVSEQGEREVGAQATLADDLAGSRRGGRTLSRRRRPRHSVEFAELWGSISECYELGGALRSKDATQKKSNQQEICVCGRSAECH